MKITPKTPINKIIKSKEEAVEILLSYGLQCVGCRFSDSDLLEDIVKLHGLSEEDLKNIIKDINSVINKKK
ncbi:MAG: hypothetical protein KatS3mg001_012 [Candidatus Pacearchaeota archaeon]|nr:MAG: hypothetical protein KatS3mg001_012 [Candidatus Pacearchaeota archaeon]